MDIEAWVYPNSLTSPASPYIFTSRYNGTYRSFFYYNSSASQLTYWSNGSARISGPALKTLNQWYHVALSSDGTTTTIWVNGKSSGTTSHMQSNYDQTMYVGAAVGSGLESAGYWNGNIADARVVKGTQYIQVILLRLQHLLQELQIQNYLYKARMQVLLINHSLVHNFFYKVEQNLPQHKQSI